MRVPGRSHGPADYMLAIARGSRMQAKSFPIRGGLAAAIALVLSSFALSMPAHAQDPGAAPDKPAAKDVTALQAVVVTGTRVFDRTEATSLAPIDVLRSEEHTSELQSPVHLV